MLLNYFFPVSDLGSCLRLAVVNRKLGAKTAIVVYGGLLGVLSLRSLQADSTVN